MPPRTLLAAALLFTHDARAAEPVTAEQLMERYRKTFPTIDDLDCPPARGDEIVACARRDRSQDYRLPLSVEPSAQSVRDTPLTTERVKLDNPYACVSVKGCAKPAIPIFGTGRRAPGAPEPLVDIVASAIKDVAGGD